MGGLTLVSSITFYLGLNTYFEPKITWESECLSLSLRDIQARLHTQSRLVLTLTEKLHKHLVTYVGIDKQSQFLPKQAMTHIDSQMSNTLNRCDDSPVENGRQSTLQDPQGVGTSRVVIKPCVDDEDLPRQFSYHLLIWYWRDRQWMEWAMLLHYQKIFQTSSIILLQFVW